MTCLSLSPSRRNWCSRASPIPPGSICWAFPMAASWWSAWPCEFADLFAAYSVAMATAPANYREECRPSRPVRSCSSTARRMASSRGTASGRRWAPRSPRLIRRRSMRGSIPARRRPIRTCRMWSRWMPPPFPCGAIPRATAAWRWASIGVERGGHQSPARVETKPGLATPFLGLRNRTWTWARNPSPSSPASAAAPRRRRPQRAPCPCLALKTGLQRRVEQSGFRSARDQHQ